jgi:hypothetical protein
MSNTRLISMIFDLIEDPELCAIFCDSPDRSPYSRRKAIVHSPENTRSEHLSTLDGASFGPPQSTARRCLHQPCPGCGSRMVRSRDLRDLCVVCGYLQAQA